MTLTHLILFQLLTGAGGSTPDNGGENLDIFLGSATSLHGTLSSATSLSGESDARASYRAYLTASTPLTVELFATSSHY